VGGIGGIVSQLQHYSGVWGFEGMVEGKVEEEEEEEEEKVGHDYVGRVYFWWGWG